jgi:hypothetical protein
VAHPQPPEDLVGVRTGPDQPLRWHRAGALPAAPGDWVTIELDGTETSAEVIVGRGQCLAYPDDPTTLPPLLGLSEPPAETPSAGRRLLESLD